MPRWAMFLFLGLAAGAYAYRPLFENAKRPVRHVIVPKEIGSLKSEACGACHEKIYARWKLSRHALAWTNAGFKASFKREPRNWCIHCHAPLPAQMAEVRDFPEVGAAPSPLADEGINCATCHVRDGAVLSTHASPDAPHPVRVDPRLGSSTFCGECHQFNFPLGGAGPITYAADPMQDTLAEWKGSHFARRASCQSCHMAGGDHRSPGAHDAAYVKPALRLAVARSKGLVRVELRTHGVAHRFPTGDMFRRVTVEICADSKCTKPVAADAFQRIFQPTKTHFTLLRDTAVPAPLKGEEAARILEIRVPAEAAKLYYRITYRLAAEDNEAEVEGSDRAIELFAGAVP